MDIITTPEDEALVFSQLRKIQKVEMVQSLDENDKPVIDEKTGKNIMVPNSVFENGEPVYIEELTSQQWLQEAWAGKVNACKKRAAKARVLELVAAENKQ